MNPQTPSNPRQGGNDFTPTRFVLFAFWLVGKFTLKLTNGFPRKTWMEDGSRLKLGTFRWLSMSGYNLMWIKIKTQNWQL